MCREDFAKVQIVGQGFDGELVTDELLTKVKVKIHQVRSQHCVHQLLFVRVQQLVGDEAAAGQRTPLRSEQRVHRQQ
jgi:hypothetical protein